MIKTFLEVLVESNKKLSAQEEEHILQVLADKDINAIVDDNVVIVDKSEVKEAKAILNKIGYGFLKVKGN